MTRDSITNAVLAKYRGNGKTGGNHYTLLGFPQPTIRPLVPTKEELQDDGIVELFSPPIEFSTDDTPHVKKSRIEASSSSTGVGLSNADLAELKSLVCKGFEKLNDKLDTMNTKLGNLTKDHVWLKEKVKSMLGVMYNTNDAVEGTKSKFEIRYWHPRDFVSPNKRVNSSSDDGV